MYIIAKRISTLMDVPFVVGFDLDHRWDKVYLCSTKESAMDFCKNQLELGEPYSAEVEYGEIIYTYFDEGPIYTVKPVVKQEELVKDHDIPSSIKSCTYRETVIRVSQGEIADKYVVLTQLSCTEEDKIKRYLHNLADFVECEGVSNDPINGHFWWGNYLQAFVFDKPELAFLFAVGVLGMDFKEACADILNAKQQVGKTEKQFAAVSFTDDDASSFFRKFDYWKNHPV